MFKLKKVYNFTTLEPSILGGEYKNMCVKSIMTYDQAVRYRDVTTLHQQLKDKIPGLPFDPKLCQFILFTTLDGEDVVFAEDYIDMNTIVEVTGVNIRIEIPNSDLDTLSMARTALLELGITNANFSTF